MTFSEYGVGPPWETLSATPMTKLSTWQKKAISQLESMIDNSHSKIAELSDMETLPEEIGKMYIMVARKECLDRVAIASEYINELKECIHKHAALLSKARYEVINGTANENEDLEMVTSFYEEDIFNFRFLRAEIREHEKSLR